jgi:hypothetical protein
MQTVSAHVYIRSVSYSTVTAMLNIVSDEWDAMRDAETLCHIRVGKRAGQ